MLFVPSDSGETRLPGTTRGAATSAGNAARHHGPTRRPVQDGGEHEFAIPDFERIDADIYRKLGPILAHAQKLETRTKWPRLPTRDELLTLSRVAGTVAIRNQLLDHSTSEFGVTVAEHALGRGVRHTDLP